MLKCEICIQQMLVYLQTGESGQQVGAIRAAMVGTGVVVEKLVAVDAEEHYL